MDWVQAVATAHVTAALAALLAGAVVLMLPKGTHAHRRIGGVYVVALVVVDVAALSLHRESAFGVFHALAIASLLTIGVALVPLLGRWSPRVIATHAFSMAWSYAGLLAAGAGQLAVAVGSGSGSGSSTPAVPVVIAVVLLAGGALIAVRVPSAIDRALTHPAPPPVVFGRP